MTPFHVITKYYFFVFRQFSSSGKRIIYSESLQRKAISMFSSHYTVKSIVPALACQSALPISRLTFGVRAGHAEPTTSARSSTAATQQPTTTTRHASHLPRLQKQQQHARTNTRRQRRSDSDDGGGRAPPPNATVVVVVVAT